MMTNLAAAGSREARAADWSGTLDADANLGYVSNPQWIPGSHASDEFGQLALDGKSVAQTELGELTITPRLSAVRYWHDTALDIDAGSLDVAYQEKFERGQWSFAGGALTDSTITSELGTTGLTATNRRHYAYNSTLGYQYSLTERLSCLVQGSWQSSHYTDAQQFGLTSYTDASALVSPSWSFSERLQGSLLLSFDRLNPGTGFVQKDQSASLQLAHSLTEQYSWRVSAGLTHVDAGSAGVSNSPVFEVAASRRSERVQWELSAKRAVLPIGLGFLAPETAATFGLSVATTEHSTFRLSLTGLRTDEVKFGGFVFYSGATSAQGSLEWRYAFSPRWTVAGVAQQGRARNLSQPWADGSQVRINVNWTSGRL